LTGTLATQAVIVSATLTTPRATRCLLRRSVTLLAWVVLTVKLVVLVTEPAEVVTLIGPVVAPAGTVAVILVDETTLNIAVRPLKVTLVAPVKFVPVIETVVPTGPKVGVNEVIVGAPAVGVTLNLWELQSVPPGVVTQIFPVVAVLGTVAVIFVDEFSVNVAETPLNVTLVAPAKFVPVIVTDAPTGPLVGEKEETVGGAAAVTVKFWELGAVPSGVVTLIGPVVAPEGTVVVIVVFEVAVNVAETPLNVTLVAPMRSVPVIVTDVPTGPLIGENEEIVGAAAQDGGAIAIAVTVIPAATAARMRLELLGRAMPGLPHDLRRESYRMVNGLSNRSFGQRNRVGRKDVRKPMLATLGPPPSARAGPSNRSGTDSVPCASRTEAASLSSAAETPTSPVSVRGSRSSPERTWLRSSTVRSWRSGMGSRVSRRPRA
jgi:hypothetical protein